MNFNKELFTSNLDIVRKSFPLESESMRALGAIMLTSQNMKADRSKLEACNAILKSQRGIFSDFRGNMRLPILVKMSIAADSEGYLRKLTAAYDILSSSFVFGASERLMAALILCDNCEESHLAEMGGKTIEVYEAMKANHAWLTSQADMAFAVLMVNAGGDATARLEDVENCYEMLKKHFTFSKDALLTVSHILSTDRALAGHKADRFMSFYNGFRDDGFKISGMYMPILAILANSDMTVEQALKVTRDNDTFLKSQKGFNVFGIAGAERRMMAAAITALDNLSAAKPVEATVASTVLSLVIQIEMLIITMIVISSTATASTTAAH